MFNDWLLNKLNELDWSQADLSRASGLTTGAISNYVSGRVPDKTALRKIAKAFNLPPETVFIAANVFQAKSTDPWLDEMNYKISQLDETRRSLAERLINTLLNEQDRENHNITIKK